MSVSNNSNIVLIEPFYGGSHKVLIDLLTKALTDLGSPQYEVSLFTMKAKKWHWRARTSALYFSEIIPHDHNYRILFASSVLNLAELLALRPDLQMLKKIVYFHENQLVYPIRQYKDRDFQYGYNQILTCLVADIIVFNSEFNRRSFLDSIKKFFSLQPDYRPKDLKARIEGKCQVLYLPLPTVENAYLRDYSDSLHIVWPHRWEHDKCPEDFLEVLYSLAESNHKFRVSLVGEQFSEVSDEFKKAQAELKEHIVHWGYLEKEEYYHLLDTAHVVVSTAIHEFYGIAMLEASMHGCFPLCPSRLVYPEIYPEVCLYKNKDDLQSKLKEFCSDVTLIRRKMKDASIDFSLYTEETLVPKFVELLQIK